MGRVELTGERMSLKVAGPAPPNMETILDLLNGDLLDDSAAELTDRAAAKDVVVPIPQVIDFPILDAFV